MRRDVFSVLFILPLLLVACGRPAPVYRTPPAELPPEVTKPPAEYGERTVRVLIMSSDRSFDVDTERAVITEMEMVGVDGRAVLSSGRHRVSIQGDRIRVTGGRNRVVSASFVRISPQDGSFFALDGRRFRGGLILRAESGTILAVNIIDIEDYIKGVLPSEIGYLGEDEYEAYKVQAVASRSYALSKLDERASAPYDLRATIMDQVYRGVEGEHPPASRAVEETRGLVGIWDGKVITAYYSACCGGHTADIRDGWPWKADYPYLHGVRDAADGEGRSFCRHSRHFRWQEEWSGSQLTALLRKTLPAELGSRVAPFSRLVDIRVDGTSASGRARALVIVTDRGEHRVEGDRIRWVMRPGEADGPILRSTLFKLDVDRSGGRVRHVTMKGAGNGHGTGMCQYGAIGMAREGYSAAGILEHYYPGITLVDLDQGVSLK